MTIYTTTVCLNRDSVIQSPQMGKKFSNWGCKTTVRTDSGHLGKVQHSLSNRRLCVDSAWQWLIPSLCPLISNGIRLVISPKTKNQKTKKNLVCLLEIDS